MSGTQNFVYQKWPNQIVPVVNFVSSHDGHFGLGGGGFRPGGGGGGYPPSSYGTAILILPCLKPSACVCSPAPVTQLGGCRRCRCRVEDRGSCLGAVREKNRTREDKGRVTSSAASFLQAALRNSFHERTLHHTPSPKGESWRW